MVVLSDKTDDLPSLWQTISRFLESSRPRVNLRLLESPATGDSGSVPLVPAEATGFINIQVSKPSALVVFRALFEKKVNIMSNVKHTTNISSNLGMGWCSQD